MTTRRRLRRLGAAASSVLVVLSAFLVLDARPAGAHAAFVSSDPEPGERLSSAPGVVVVRFSEPLVPRLSDVVVQAPDGERFEGRVTADHGQEIVVTLRTNAPGVYEVDWHTVSPLDGHTLKGGFRFGVGVDPGGTGAGTVVGPSDEDLALAPLRAVEDAALLATIGGWALAVLARRRPPLAWVRPSTRAPLLLALVAGTGVVLGEALLAARSVSLDGVGTYLTAESGLPRLARVALEAIGVQLAVLGWSGAATAAAGGALVALAASGHARVVDPAAWGIVVDSAHLLAAGLWAGALLRLPRMRPPSGWRGSEARELLRRFTPIAIPAFVATVAFGTLRSTQELAGLGDLLDSSYGRLLSLKIVAVVAMVPLSIRAWRRRRPVPKAEAFIGVGVVVLAASLAAYPLPPRRAAEAGAEPEKATRPEVPRQGDLAFGLTVGDQLVGVTVRPARPGHNEVFLHPVVAGSGSVPELRLGVGGRNLPLDDCGPTCRRTDADLTGGETIRVHAPRTSGGSGRISLPPLPVPDGTDVLERADRRMDALRSYSYDETLGPVDPPVRAAYEFRVPDRMHLRLESGAETIRIGTSSWRRESPDNPWEHQKSPPLEIPNFIWDQPRRRAITVVGSDSLDGVETRVVSFFASTVGGTEIWYRLWIDDDRLVQRAEMLAAGHFMEQRFSGFDPPVDIGPPTPAR